MRSRSQGASTSRFDQTRRRSSRKTPLRLAGWRFVVVWWAEPSPSRPERRRGQIAEWRQRLP
jgi:hypothetical protein